MGILPILLSRTDTRNTEFPRFTSVSRSLNGYFNVGYSFDDRYLMDFSLRSSGSSVFGSSKNTTRPGLSVWDGICTRRNLS